MRIKAFDKVWHKGLIHKMNCYEIKGNLLKWFEHYLYCRHQKVVNRDSSSSYVSVSAGVPQGSVLASLLFLVYINAIGDKLLSLSRLFADDTSLGNASQDEEFYVSNLCAILYRKPLRNHRKQSNIVLFFQESLR
jgi:hypothetical protein